MGESYYEIYDQFDQFPLHVAVALMCDEEPGAWKRQQPAVEPPYLIEMKRTLMNEGLVEDVWAEDYSSPPRRKLTGSACQKAALRKWAEKKSGGKKHPSFSPRIGQTRPNKPGQILTRPAELIPHRESGKNNFCSCVE